jgi:hypothetical protein
MRDEWKVTINSGIKGKVVLFDYFDQSCVVNFFEAVKLFHSSNWKHLSYDGSKAKQIALPFPQLTPSATVFQRVGLKVLLTAPNPGINTLPRLYNQ